jgi:N-acetylmuramoyl-L-alanine amidase
MRRTLGILISFLALTLVAGLAVAALRVSQPDARPADAGRVAVRPAAAFQPGGGTRQPGGRRESRPLAGALIVIDPGHQLGNHNFPRRINRLVPAGGFAKPCNTTGTATRSGYPEATMVFGVAKATRARLRALGARVWMTRHANRQDRWGPCVDVRGRRGNQAAADLKISIHGDGYDGPGHGFHVIAPADRRPWTHDIFGPSRRLAGGVRAALKARGVPAAGYVAGGDGLDFRSDLATLNLSNVPAVMVELGNMRSRADARRMTSCSGRAAYARALVAASRRFLAR